MHSDDDGGWPPPDAKDFLAPERYGSARPAEGSRRIDRHRGRSLALCSLTRCAGLPAVGLRRTSNVVRMDAMRSRGSIQLNAADPVTEAYQSGIDVTLIRENLRRSPEERLRALEQLQAFAEELRRGGSEMRRKRRE